MPSKRTGLTKKEIQIHLDQLLKFIGHLGDYVVENEIDPVVIYDLGNIQGSIETLVNGI